MAFNPIWRQAADDTRSLVRHHVFSSISTFVGSWVALIVAAVLIPTMREMFLHETILIVLYGLIGPALVVLGIFAYFLFVRSERALRVIILMLGTIISTSVVIAVWGNVAVDRFFLKPQATQHRLKAIEVMEEALNGPDHVRSNGVAILKRIVQNAETGNLQDGDVIEKLRNLVSGDEQFDFSHLLDDTLRDNYAPRIEPDLELRFRSICRFDTRGLSETAKTLANRIEQPNDQLDSRRLLYFRRPFWNALNGFSEQVELCRQRLQDLRRVRN